MVNFPPHNPHLPGKFSSPFCTCWLIFKGTSLFPLYSLICPEMVSGGYLPLEGWSMVEVKFLGGYLQSKYILSRNSFLSFKCLWNSIYIMLYFAIILLPSLSEGSWRFDAQTGFEWAVILCDHSIAEAVCLSDVSIHWAVTDFIVQEVLLAFLLFSPIICRVIIQIVQSPGYGGPPK